MWSIKSIIESVHAWKFEDLGERLDRNHIPPDIDYFQISAQAHNSAFLSLK